MPIERASGLLEADTAIASYRISPCLISVFRKFCNTNNQSKLGVAVEDEPVLYKELDKLVALGLLSIVAGGGNTAQLAFRRVCPAIERATLRECVVGFEPLPQALQFYMESEVDKD